MKKSILLSLVLILFLFLNASAENILVLTNSKTHETNVFRKGSYVVFQLKADQSMDEGYIRDITDSSLVLDYSQVSLSQITIFAGSTKSKIVAGRVAHAVGNTMVFAGTAVFNCGTNILVYNDYYYWPIGGTIWMAGACLAGLGYIFDWALGPPEHSIRVRDYRNWDASIADETLQPDPDKQVVQQSDTTQTIPDEPKKEKRKKEKYLGDDVYGN